MPDAELPGDFAIAVVRLWRDDSGEVRARLLWRSQVTESPVTRSFAETPALVRSLEDMIADWRAGNPS